MLLRTATYSLFLLLLLPAKALLGLSSDPLLLQLIPPQSRLVAGMSSSAAQGKTGSFLLITPENKADLTDFFALSGGDASRRMHSVLFVTAADTDRKANGHSLLVSGQFDRDSIFRFAAKSESRERYRDIPVLVVPPFARERGAFDEVRWLAVLDGRIAVFGSVESVQRELDRWIERSAPEPMLVDRLQRLGGRDDTWCVLLARDAEAIAESALGRLDPRLGAVAHTGGLLAYGIKFGRKIEVVVTADPFPTTSRSAPEDVPGAGRGGAMHMLSISENDAAGSRAAVKVSLRRYQEWIERTVPPEPLLAVR